MLGNPAAIFQKRLVDSGLTFGVGINYYTQAHVGPITLFAQTAPDKVLPAQKAIMRGIGKLGDDRLTSRQGACRGAATARDTRRCTSASSHQLRTHRGFLVGRDRTGLLPDLCPEDAEVTRADLAAYARKYIVGKPHVTGLLVSPAARTQFKFTRRTAHAERRRTMKKPLRVRSQSQLHSR